MEDFKTVFPKVDFTEPLGSIMNSLWACKVGCFLIKIYLMKTVYFERRKRCSQQKEKNILYPYLPKPSIAQSAGGYKIHGLLLSRRVKPPNECHGYDTNNLMVRFQYCWSFGESRVPLHCHRSLVHSGPE